MKKVILFLSFIIVSVVMYGQEISNHAIGLRFGDSNGLGTEISYQKSLGENNRLEAGLAWRSKDYYNAFKLTGTYQWVFDLEGLDGVNWYVGAGGGIGSWAVKKNQVGDGGTFLFIAGDIGVEYKFDIPLLIALDFRPELGFVDYNNDLGLDIALALRYTF